MITLPHNWVPRSYQLDIWTYMASGGLRAEAVWHRRAGKDEVCLHWTACASQMRIGNYWHMLPQAKQARKALWDAVNPHTGIRRIDEAFPLEMRENTKDQEMLIRFRNGSTWQVLGSDNYQALVGSPPVGLVFSEWALADPGAWGFLRPILLENKGWALFIGTPRGRNHAKRTHDLAMRSVHWFGQVLTVDDTNLFTDEQLEMEREELIELHGEDLGEALFRQEYHCSFDAAIVGAFFSKEMRELRQKGRISNKVQHIRSLPVHTWWDIGVRDPTAIIFVQFDGPRVLIIDYFFSTGAGIAEYAQVLKDKKQEEGYVYGAHVGPHDLENREFGSSEKIRTMAEKHGVHFDIAPKLSKTDSIQHIRKMLPKCWFNEEKCSTLIEALEQHRAEYDEESKTIGLVPVHDWTSHPVDAFKYGAQSPSYFFTQTWEDEFGDPWDQGGQNAYDDEFERCAI